LREASTPEGPQPVTGAEPEQQVTGGAAAPAAGLGSRALRNTVLVLAARVGSRFLVLLTVIAIGNHLGDVRFGQFQTLVNYTGLVAVLIDLGFGTLYVREAARRPAESGKYLATLLPLRAVLALLALGVLALALRLPGLQDLLLPGFVLMVLASYAGLLRGTFYAQQQLRYEAMTIVLEAAVLLTLVLIGVREGAGLAYFVWAYAAGYAFSCAFILAILLGRRMVTLAWGVDLAMARRWFWNGLPFALTFVISTLYFRIDVPILQLLRSYAEVGWYTFAYKPFEALLFVPISMFNVIFPVLSVFYRDAPGRLSPAIEKFQKSLLLVGWPLTVGTVTLAPGLNHLLRLYPNSEPALRILGLGIVFLFVSNAYIAALNSIDRQAEFTKAALASLVVNVALNLSLIPAFGYLGAAAATVLTEAFLVVTGWWLTARHLARVPVLRPSWRIVLAGLAMGAVLLPVRDVRGWPVLAVVVLGALVYAAALVLLRAFDAEEIGLLRRALRGGVRP
jgi:O-antigen/teichoic acid export membrane protein